MKALKRIVTAGFDGSEVESGGEYSISNGEASNDEESDQSDAADINLEKNPAWHGNQIIKKLGSEQVNKCIFPVDLQGSTKIVV